MTLVTPLTLTSTVCAINSSNKISELKLCLDFRILFLVYQYCSDLCGTRLKRERRFQKSSDNKFSPPTVDCVLALLLSSKIGSFPMGDFCFFQSYFITIEWLHIINLLCGRDFGIALKTIPCYSYSPARV